MAQTHSNAVCLDLGALAGQPAKALWANSFSAFLDAHRAELSAEQAKLIRQAIDFGSSRKFSLNDAVSLGTMKGLVAAARKVLTDDQFSEIMANMGPETQWSLLAVGVVDDVACSCTKGAGSGCPEGFPCTVGCHTWGTGEWNGICVRQAQPQN
jgi:hypothetical protein